MGGAEGAEGAEEDVDSAPKGDFGYAALAIIDAVIQFTRLNIHEVYRMEANECLTYAEYIRTRERKKADEINKIQRR